MKNPVVSVVTAIYNGVDYIEDNILSVKNQDYSNIEHIIIDGGSKDGTVDIIKKYTGTYNLKWVSEKDGGIYDAFNKGFSMATGDIYTWLDGDNYFQPGVVRKVVDVFEKGSGIDIVCGDIEIVSNDGKRVKVHHAPEISFRNALIKNTGAIPLQPAVFFRKELYEKAVDFDTHYRIAADYDFWLRVLKDNPNIFHIRALLGSYRRGNDAASQSFKGVFRGYQEMRTIGGVHGQPFYAKIFLFSKYFAGAVLAFVKKYLNG